MRSKMMGHSTSKLLMNEPRIWEEAGEEGGGGRGGGRILRKKR